MPASEFQHRMAGGTPTRVRRWLPDATPRAVMLVVHGMAEHGGRYARLGGALSAGGVAVYAHDLPGHGPETPPEQRGHFADHRGWRLACASIRDVHKLVEKEQPGVPVFLLGHSMGSYLVQYYMADWGTGLAGVVLSATSGAFGAQIRIGHALMRSEALVYGLRRPSTVGALMGFKSFNRPFKPARTDFDWLSRDAAEVDKYVADELCGFPCTTGLWLDLLAALRQLGAPARLRRLPRALPVLVVGGERDSAAGGAKGPRSLEKLYRQAGLADLTVRIYPDARHELFNDTCRDEVTADLLQWLQAHVKAP